MQLVQRTRDVYNSGKTRPIEWRIKQLKQMSRMLKETMPSITAALEADLRKVRLRNFKKKELRILYNPNATFINKPRLIF